MEQPCHDIHNVHMLSLQTSSISVTNSTAVHAKSGSTACAGNQNTVHLCCRNNSAPVVSGIAVVGNSTVDISSTLFVNQLANSTTGGALYVGSGSRAYLHNITFDSNNALDGGLSFCAV